MRWTYSEGTPAIDISIIGKCESSAISSGNLNKHGAFGERVARDSGRDALFGVQAAVALLAAVTLVVIDIFHSTIPGCIPPQRALIVDTPSENLVVVSESRAMHATDRDLNDANSVR